MRRRAARDRLNETEAAFYLGFDIIQLAALLFVTGGLGNPFALLLLAPVTVSAAILGRRSTIRLCLLALACATLLAFAHLRSEEHTSELQSLMRISYAVFCLKKKKS